MDSYTLHQALDIAKYYYRADLPFALEGPHGIGKSLGLKALTDSLGIGFVDLRLTLFEETDLIGAPYKPDNSDKTAYTKPIWLSLIEATNMEKGLLCLEELNRCDALVRQPALQLIWDRRCSHWDLPTGWLPVATWNPSDGDYETVELDPALLSRLIKLKVEPDVETWVNWARENRLSPLIIDFVASNPSHLVSKFITPRTWSMAAKLVQEYPENLELLKPLLGNIYTIFDQWLSATNTTNPAELFACSAAAEKIAVSLVKPAARYAFEGSLIKHLREIDAAGGRITEKFLECLQAYLTKIPPDSVISWFERLKAADHPLAMKIAKGFSKGFRSNTIPLMKHVFGEAHDDKALTTRIR